MFLLLTIVPPPESVSGVQRYPRSPLVSALGLQLLFLGLLGKFSVDYAAILNYNDQNLSPSFDFIHLTLKGSDRQGD